MVNRDWNQEGEATVSSDKSPGALYSAMDGFWKYRLEKGDRVYWGSGACAFRKCRPTSRAPVNRSARRGSDVS